MGSYDDGARVLDRVLVLDPRYAVGRATVALGWMMQGRQKEAVALLTGMTEALPDFLTAWIYLGIEQLNMACWSEAERSFDYTLALAPENPTCLSLLAQAYVGQNRAAEAREIAARLHNLGTPRYVSPSARMIATMAAGDHACALEAVTAAATERDANFALYCKCVPFIPYDVRRSS